MPEVTLREIERIFYLLERVGFSREAVVIPLTPRHPGSVRRLPGGKIEIVVDSETPFDIWLVDLEEKLREAS